MMEAITVARQMADRISNADLADEPPLRDEIVSALRELAFACENLERRTESLERSVRGIGSHPALI